jgi:hypothetical protein
MKTTRDERLDTLLGEHRDLSGQIMDLRNQRCNVEHKVKKEILRNNDLDLLNVNWTRVNRRYR